MNALACWIGLLVGGQSAAVPSARLARPPFTVEAPGLLDVPSFDSPAAQLRYATRCKLLSWSAAAGELAEARRRAVLAFQAVRERFPAACELGAEASFRAGELLRAGGQRALAAREFRAAVELGRRTDFRARAWIELGRIEQRAGRTSPALEAFEAVVVDREADLRWREEAALEIGRAWADVGRIDDARRWLQRVAELGEDALLRVRAYDAWALTYVDASDFEAAAGVLALARTRLAAFAREETELGVRVARALERMSCITRLEDALARRWRAESARRGR